jgi:hypothetical protein
MNIDADSLSMSAVAELVLRRPDFEHQFIVDCAELPLGLEELRRIELFRGLICMIKHAFMWNRTPRLRSVLKSSGSEIAFFSAYTQFTSLKDILEWDINQREIAVLAFARDVSHLKSLGLDRVIGISGLAAHVLNAREANTQAPPMPSFTPISKCSYLRPNPLVKIGFYDSDPRSSSWCNECELKPGVLTVVYGVGEPIVLTCERLAIILTTRHSWVKVSDVINELRTPDFTSAKIMELLSSLARHGIILVEYRYA